MTLDPASRTRLVDGIHQLRGSIVGSVMARGREEDLAEFGLSLARSGLLSDAPGNSNGVSVLPLPGGAAATGRWEF